MKIIIFNNFQTLDFIASYNLFVFFFVCLLCKLAYSVFAFCSLGGKVSAYNVGDLDSIPGSGRSPGEGNGYQFQYSDLENSMDCIVHGVAQSRTQLK